MEKYTSVAIDGPCGAGKSTMSRAAAVWLGRLYGLSYIHVDTGALYRTIGVAVRERDLSPQDSDAVSAILPELDIGVQYAGQDGLQRMLLNGRDVTDVIREPDISMYASAVAAIPAVRAFLLELQRDFARTHNVIMDGRDIGTVVLPDADVKIFLTASVEVRVRRRWKELSRRGTPQDYKEILADIRQRDWNDSHRAEAPLRQAPDAILLDTSKLSFRESVLALIDLIRKGEP